MQIFIATAGHYDSYRIVGAFSNPAAAELASKLAGMDPPEVATYELDPEQATHPEGKFLYVVTCYLVEGIANFDAQITNTEDAAYLDDKPLAVGESYIGTDFAYVWAKDKEEALAVVDKVKLEASEKAWRDILK